MLSYIVLNRSVVTQKKLCLKEFIVILQNWSDKNQNNTSDFIRIHRLCPKNSFSSQYLLEIVFNNYFCVKIVNFEFSNISTANFLIIRYAFLTLKRLRPKSRNTYFQTFFNEISTKNYHSLAFLSLTSFLHKHISQRILKIISHKYFCILPNHIQKFYK